MNEQKLKNLYDAFTSQIEYSNFIESKGNLRLDLSKVDFDMLIVHFSSFLFTSIIDKYFKVQDNEIHTTLFSEYIKEIADILVEPVNGKYQFGELIYSSPEKVLEKIRNKLAHGDYTVEDLIINPNGEIEKCIVFEENKAKGVISITRLVAMVATFLQSHEKYDRYQPYTKYLMTVNPNKIKKIKNEKDFLNICFNTYVIEITDTPVVPTQRSISYVNGREQFFDIIKQMINLHLPIDEIKTFIEHKIEIFRSRGVNMSVKVTRVTDLDYFPEIKKSVQINRKVYKQLSPFEQTNYILLKSHLHSNGIFQKWNLEQGTFINLMYLVRLKEKPHSTYRDLRGSNIVNPTLILAHNEDILISPLLVGFNIIYQYGLEKEFSKIGRNNLVDILYGNSLNFEYLRLDAFYSDINELEKNFDNFDTDIDTYYEKNSERIISQMEAIKKIIEQIESNDKMDHNLKMSKLESFKEQLLELDEELDSLEFEVETLKARAEDFDNSRYTLNFNIITHIRNAIAHGNIYISNNKADLNDAEIIIIDYNKGKEVYKKQLKLSDFMSLFDYNNIAIIFDFISDNIKDKSNIDNGYVHRVVQNIEDAKNS